MHHIYITPKWSDIFRSTAFASRTKVKITPLVEMYALRLCTIFTFNMCVCVCVSADSLELRNYCKPASIAYTRIYRNATQSRCLCLCHTARAGIV